MDMSYQEIRVALQEMGFSLIKEYTVAKNIDEIHEFYEKMFTDVSSINYCIDGIVCKIDNKDLRKVLGHTSTAPRSALAYKLPSESCETWLLNVITQMGKYGNLAPVGIVSPVEI